MESVLKELKSELKTQLASGLRGRKLQILTDKAIRIATLESLLLRNMRSRQRLEGDVLLLEAVLNLARIHHGHVMLADLIELAELPALRRAIALGTSRNLITKYNDSDGWLQHEEIRLVDYDYPQGSQTTGSEDWHYFRRQRVIDGDKEACNHLRLIKAPQ